jgi:predicted AlkP superfamily phosphohydrolase/phosphomutase
MKPLALALLALLSACSHSSSAAHGKRVIVLGVDAMDPHFVEAHWDVLPNLRRLRDLGGLTQLATTTPPQSPVAWATFITGMDPAEHGIFDFVHRDPATLQPLSSMAETLDAAYQLRIGPYLLPLSPARVHSFRTGRPFWRILEEHGIPVTVIRMPTNYPPAEGKGQALAGMGTPDLQGTFGTFTFYSDDPSDVEGEVPGGRIVRVISEGSRVVLPIEGPANTLRKDRRPTHADVIADIDPDAAVARMRIEDQQFILRQGEWSPWIRVRFPLIGPLAGAAGMFRLYVRELHPGIRIYRSPLNVDPGDPALPISRPASYSRQLAARTGPFYTQGIEEDTSALRQGALSLPEYLEQSRLVSQEHSTLLLDALDHFRDGFLFFYFSEIDQNSHVLWGKHEAELTETYRSVDREIGTVLDRFGDATVIVMSDHGFAAFNRAVNLNTWLWREGFLQLDDARNAGQAEMFTHVDWKRTRAYAMGLNALYINLSGRDKYGIVQPGSDRDGLIHELVERLERFHDPAAGRRVIASVTPMGKTSSRYAPDLIVGYAPGYRASWETGMGAVPAGIIRDNTDAWIGDHCIDARAVPGVLLGNRKPRLTDPRLKDLTVTVLREFGVPIDKSMTGRPVY